ncbi:hypothetical protein DMUE_1043 [Dictyocoela muelleri]|nr:hypothetical protein DMUE_1043 [Dictyocoela muelleri]
MANDDTMKIILRNKLQRNLIPKLSNIKKYSFKNIIKNEETQKSLKKLRITQRFYNFKNKISFIDKFNNQNTMLNKFEPFINYNLNNLYLFDSKPKILDPLFANSNQFCVYYEVIISSNNKNLLYCMFPETFNLKNIFKILSNYLFMINNEPVFVVKKLYINYTNSSISNYEIENSLRDINFRKKYFEEINTELFINNVLSDLFFLIDEDIFTFEISNIIVKKYDKPFFVEKFKIIDYICCGCKLKHAFYLILDDPILPENEKELCDECFTELFIYKGELRYPKMKYKKIRRDYFLNNN